VNPKKLTLLIVGSAIVLIVLLAGIAVLLSDDDGGDPVASVPDGQSSIPSDLEETRPVEAAGEPLVPFARGGADPAIGTAAPVVAGQSFDGTAVTTGGATGRPSMLVFLAHWCPHCNDEIPELIELRNRGGVPAELDVIGISTGVQSDQPNYPPSKWLADRDWPWPVMADDSDATAFLFNGGSGFPYLMLLDEDGNVLARDSGTKSAEDLAVWIQAALSGAAA
jgi:thiol-disulfide isomerase/thioredoxin